MLSQRFNSILRPRAMSAAIVALLTATGAGAQVHNERPEQLRGVDIVERLDERLPLDAAFVDESGRSVTLGDFFTADRPVIITLNYFRCPMLCTYQLNGMVSALKEVEFEPGRDFSIVTISFDPSEDAGLARLKKDAYLTAYPREGAQDGWAFLTGDEANIRKVTEAIGFGYRWDESRGEWAHGSAIFIATPDGRLSRYVYGLEFEPKTVRLALLEAGEGRIGSTVDRFLLWCFHYDDTTGQYTPHVMRIMQICGGITVLALGSGLLMLWRREARLRRAPDSDTLVSDMPTT
jgi:protein SCO1/2